MLSILLGSIDILAAASLASLSLGYPLPTIQAIAGLALIAKGAMFISDILSVFDIAIGIALFVLIWMQAPILALSLAVWLAFKGAYTYA